MTLGGPEEQSDTSNWNTHPPQRTGHKRWTGSHGGGLRGKEKRGHGRKKHREDLGVPEHRTNDQISKVVTTPPPELLFSFLR